MANENWVEIKPKSRQGPNMGEPLQRNPKNSGTIEKEAKGKDQGLLKEEILVKPPDAPEAIKGHKEPEHSRSDKHPAPSGTNIGQHQLSMGLQPPLHNIIWQPFQLDDSKFKVLAMRMTSLWMTRLIVYLWS